MFSAELKLVDFNNVRILNRDDACLELLKPRYCLSLILSIGMSDSKGADYFYVDVFNIGWVKENKFVAEGKSIVVDLDDFDELESYLRNLISKISGENWLDIVKKLKKYFYWEYDDERFL